MLMVCLSGAVPAEPPVGFSLSFSAGQNPQRLFALRPTDHFHVLLANRGDHQQRIWQTWNYWGYYTLSFQITDSAGKSWVVKKRNTMFTRNVPSFLAIPPGQTYVFDIYFGDKHDWDGFPIRRGEEHTVQIRALYDVPVSSESKTYEVWTGHLKSESIQVTFVR